jgi:hypothetical protein
MKVYFTFGQDHAHRVNNVTLDKDIVAVVEAPTETEARELVWDWFGGGKFAFSYPEDKWDEDDMKYFPRGYAYLN